MLKTIFDVGNFSVVNHSSCVLHLRLGCVPSSALVSGDRGLGPLDRAEQPPATDKCRRPWTGLLCPPRSQRKCKNGRFPQRPGCPAMAQGVPSIPAVEPQLREVRFPHSSRGWSRMDPQPPKPSWREEGAHVRVRGRVKKRASFRRWALRLPQHQVTRRFCA